MKFICATYTCLILLVFSPASDAKKRTLENLNLTINLGSEWITRDHPVADLALINITTGEAIVIHKLPLHTINDESQIPQNFDEFKTYIKDSYLKSQLDMLSSLIGENTAFKAGVKNRDMKGPLITMSGELKGTELNFFMWIPWQGHGAYTLNFVSPKSKNRDEEHFLQLIKKISISDKKSNPFLVNNQLELDTSRQPIVNHQFNIKLNQFKGYAFIDNSELEILNEENFYTFMVINQKNGDFISSIPHCFEMNEEQQMATLKTISQLWLETAYYEDSFQSNGTEVPYLKGEGVNEEIKQLSIHTTIKKLQDCYHVILVASSNRFEDNTNIKLVYDNLKNLTNEAHQVEFHDASSSTAFANYYVAAATTLQEQGYNALNFFQAAYDIVPSVEHLNLLLNQMNDNADYFSAINLITQAEASIQEHPHIMSWHAWFLRQTEAFEPAIEQYTQLFNQSYTSDEDFFIFIDLLDNNSAWSEAYDWLNKNLDQVAKRSTALAYMVKYAAYSNQPETTMKALDIIQQENRINLENVFDVLDGLYELNEYDQLMTILNDQISQHPENLRLHYYSADIQYGIGKYDEALAAIEKAAKISPDNEQVKELAKSIQLNVGVGNYQSINNPIKPVMAPKALQTQLDGLAFKNQGDAEYLFYTVGIDYQKGKQLRTTYNRKIKINNLKGVESFKTITFDFDQSYEDVYINHFEVLDSDLKTVQKLDIKTVYLSTKQDGITADDDMVINIPVPNLSENMIISYEITTETKSPKSEFPYNKHFYLSTYPMSMKSVFINGDVADISALSKQPLSIHEDDQFKAWSTQEIPVIKYFPMMPYTEDMANWLILNPKDQQWSDVGDEYLDDIADKLNSPISKGRKLSIFAGASSPEQKIVKAANFVQNSINYQALEFGTRALIPNRSSETLVKGYGDCKDHAVLLYDLLNSVGIKAHLALVQTAELVNSATPALDQFDHMIVYLPEFQGGMFIDTTDKELKITAQLPPQNLQDTAALIIKENNSELLTIPSAEAKHNQIIVERQVAKDMSHLNITETIQMTGYMASGMRHSLKNNQTAELEQNVQMWLAAEYSELELVSFEYFGLGDNQSPLVIEMVTRIEADEDSINLPFFIEKNYLNKSLTKQRDVPFLLNTPFELQSQTQFEPSLKAVKNDTELSTQQHPAVDWSVDFNNNQISFSATNHRYQGDAEAYDKYVKTIKKGLKTLEKIVNLSE